MILDQSKSITIEIGDKTILITHTLLGQLTIEVDGKQYYLQEITSSHHVTTKEGAPPLDPARPTEALEEKK